MSFQLSIRWALLVLGCLAIVPPASLPAQDKRPGIHYTVALPEGLPAEVAEAIRAHAALFTRQDTPPLTRARLRHRFEEDRPLIQKILQANGYFQARVDYSLHSLDDGGHRVDLGVATGPVFTLQGVEVALAEGAAPQTPTPDLEDAGLVLGKPYKAAAVLKAQERIDGFYAENGYPFAARTDQRILVDHARQAVEVSFTVDPGPEAVFGELSVTGLTEVEREHVDKLLPWKRGDPYKASRLRAFTKQALASGLFALAEAKPAEDLTEGGELPINAAMRERKHRTWSAGGEYATELGPGLSLGYEHRNLFGKGETVSAEASVNTKQYLLDTRYRVPFFLRKDQRLEARASAGYEDLEAYEATFGDLQGLVYRQVLPELELGAGLGWRSSSTQDRSEDQRRDINLVYLPVSLLWDSRDNALNPGSGLVLSASAAPYADVLGQGEAPVFYRAVAEASTYLSLGPDSPVILALRAKAGQVFGIGREMMPADLRFYAGGGGSVRGYGFQAAGELDDDDAPLGGVSVLEFSLEPRFRVTDKLQLVAFLDAGRAFPDGVDLEAPLFKGVGVGARYDLGIAPVRFDIGFPLDRRDGVDDAFAVYFGIGQAF